MPRRTRPSDATRSASVPDPTEATAGGIAVLDAPPVNGTPAEAPPGDATDLLMIERRRRRAITPITRVLVLLLVAGLGIFAGACLEQGRSTSSTSLPAGLPSGGAAGLPDFAALGGAAPGGGAFPTGAFPGGALPGGAAGSGATGGGLGAGGGTIGTVKLVDGNNIYIQDPTGNVTKITTEGATITVSKPGAAADLQPGQSVTIQGTKGADGSIAATSITGTNRAATTGAPGS